MPVLCAEDDTLYVDYARPEIGRRGELRCLMDGGLCE